MVGRNQDRDRDHDTDRISNGQLMAALTQLSQEFHAFRDIMPDAYMPRRETEQRFTAQQQAFDALDKRVIAQEEWRLAETKNAGDRQAALTAQINAAVQQQTRDTASAAVQAQQTISQQRAAIDGRTVTFYGSLILTLISVIFAIVSPHLGWH